MATSKKTKAKTGAEFRNWATHRLELTSATLFLVTLTWGCSSALQGGKTSSKSNTTSSSSSSDSSSTSIVATPTPSPTPSTYPSPTAEWVMYQRDNGRIYRTEAKASGAILDVTAALGTSTSVSTSTGAMSVDGQYIVTLITDSTCNSCLAISQAPFTSYQFVKYSSSHTPIQWVESPAVGLGGTRVFYSTNGKHTRDVFMSAWNGSSWSTPVNLTTTSIYNYNSLTHGSFDGNKVVFTCTNSTSVTSAAQICEMSADGTGSVSVVLTPGVGNSFTTTYHPSYGPTGNYVFEGDSPVEQIWTLVSGAPSPTLISTVTDDNSPCVLPSGRIASLWDTDIHHLRIANADGSIPFASPESNEISDVGIFCGGQ